MNCLTGKKEFKTEKDAWEGAINSFRQHHIKVFSVYQCECGMWHLTSQQDTRPYWVKRAMERSTRRQLKADNEARLAKKKDEQNKILEQSKFKEAIAKLNNQPYKPWWKFWG